MQFHKPTTEFCAGSDLHWDNMVLCIVGPGGETLVHRRLRNDIATLRRIIAPYAHSLTIAAESTGTWYWLCDACAELGVEFVLGHALYMKWIHGAKAKDDFIDSEKIARILMGGNFPPAYAHPKELRATRDLLRRRGHFVNARTGMMSHLKTLNAQANMSALRSSTKTKKTRDAIPELFDDPDMGMSAEVDVVTIDFYESAIAQLEKHIRVRTKEYNSRDLGLLMTTPGIGKILSLTIALEIHDIARFPTRQDFSSYCRLINTAHVSNGKRFGSAGHKIGNVYLKWAFGEVATLSIQKNERINALRQRLQKRHGAGRSLSILAHKFGRAIYYMLKNGTAFDEERFLRK